MARHKLPAFVHARNLPVALRFSANVVDDRDGTIVCDAAELTFVDPSGLCVLAAACQRLSALGKRLVLENVPDAIAGYLARMDFFKACGIQYEEKFVRHDRASALVELRVLDKRSDVDECSRRITQALLGAVPNLDREAQRDEMTGYNPYDRLYVPLRYIFSELLENALTHGRRDGYRSATAWLAAQYYSSNDRIRLAVLDNGCSLLGSLRHHADLPARNHVAAIRFALLPRVTCNPELEIAPGHTANQGVGLTVVKEMACRSRGVMRIASGDHVLEVSGGRERTFGISPWQGVILALEFERELLRQIDRSQIIQSLIPLPGPRGLRFE